MSEPIKIQLDARSRAFYQGNAAGGEVAASMADLRQPHDQMVKYFWLIVGTKLAASGIDGDDDEGVSAFVQGAALNEPSQSD